MSEGEFRLGPRGWLMLVGVMLATVLEILDSSIVNVALPSMMGNFGATLDEASWIVTSYILANVIVIPMTSWLADRFGRKRYFTASILLFTAASCLCGLARSVPELVLFRTIQGLGGGALLSTAQSIMVETFPVERQGTGQAVFGMGAMLGPSLGPTLGGWLTDQWSWPWIFYINLPLGLVSAFLCANYLPPRAHRGRRDAPVDWAGIALLVVGIGALQYVLERGHRLDWFESASIRGLAATAAFALAAFVVHELRAEHPIVQLRVLRHRSLLVGCTYGTVMGIGLYGSVFLFPVFTQGVLRWTPWQSGLAMLPASLATAISMPIVGRLLWRTGPAPLFAVGLCFFLPSLYAMSQWTRQSGWSDLLVPQIGRGIAMGFMFVPLSTATLRGLPLQDVLQSAGLYTLSRQLGGSFGVAALATIMDHRSATHRAYLAESVSLLSAATLERLGALSAGFQARGLDAVSALDAARRALSGIVSSESAVLAFRDCYFGIALLFALLVPLVGLLRRPSPQPPPSPAH